MTSFGCIGKLRESAQFEWDIGNFFDFLCIKGSFYTSPSFTFANGSFHLAIYPAGTSKNEPDFISLFLERESGCPFHVSYTLSMEKSDGTLIVEKKDMGVYLQIFSGYSNFYKKSNLYEKNPSGGLIINCQLQMNQNGNKNTFKPKRKEKFRKKQVAETFHHTGLTELNILSKNLKDLFSDTDSCDIVLEVQDKVFRAHKIILVARSFVFAAMFRHDTLEKKTSLIKIPDCDPGSFQEFLEYLYCGILRNISFRSAYHLYSTSNKYEVMELKAFCIKYLVEKLSVDNICEVFILADTYDETDLLSAVQIFFNQNWSKIVSTTEWESLMKNDYRLANKLLVGMSKTKEESH